MKERTLKCDVCGRFISYQDLADQKATHSLVTPDSDLSHEEFETLCRDHTWTTLPGIDAWVRCLDK